MNFDNIDTLIFDFDGVMWDFKENHEYFNQWVVGFVKTLQDCLNIESYEEAYELNMNFFKEYGSTYKGFAAYVKKNGGNLPSKYDFWGASDKYLYASGIKIKPDEKLVELVKNIKGKKKYILSNNRIEYIEYGLKSLGLDKSDFDGISCIESDDLMKPEPEFYQKLIDKFELINIQNKVFFDDKDTFLETAKLLGISTVWITEKTDERNYVDFKTNNIKNILKNLV